MMRMRTALAAAWVLTLAACAAPAAGPRPDPGAEAAIRDVLLESVEAWNRGSLEGFVLPYDTAATFVAGSDVLRGRGAIRERYATSYFRTGTPTGVLAFQDMEVRMLSPRDALVVGRYRVVSRADATPVATGLFTLLMALRPDGWRIVHDHSS